MGSRCRIIPVKNRLGQKLRMTGGVSREAAMAAAGQNVESLRESFVAAIPDEIAALEEILHQSGRQHIDKQTLDAMLCRADQMLTLSGTFGFDQLDEVIKRFCDLAIGMMEKDIDKLAPVEVHLHAMRLVCPGGAEVGKEEASHMLKSLERVHAHLGIKRLDGSTPAALPLRSPS